jgi:hypothetical protein
MLLGGKLFRTQGIGSCDLGGQGISIRVTKRQQRDSCNQGVIRDHHCHRSEQSLKVIWQLRTTSVTGVHCNETVASPLDGDQALLKDELLLLIGNGFLNGLDLLGNDRKYLKLDTIELIEA